MEKKRESLKLSTEPSRSSEKQSGSTLEINGAIGRIACSVQDASAAAQENLAADQGLSAQAKGLTNLLTGFQIA
ncbi:MAG: hypothetical protein LBQ15_10060 [Clostridium sp.]|jgi:methyl-accepting chemotaxis protein|nr:hypothetical protein [Clostridium sp.]